MAKKDSKKNPEVIYIGHGVGNYIGGRIYLNKDLIAWPRLHKRVLDHELKHARGESHVDLNEWIDRDWVLFMMSHPLAWTQYFPIARYDGMWAWHRFSMGFSLIIAYSAAFVFLLQKDYIWLFSLIFMTQIIGMILWSIKD